jgi:F-type H+-transporting ATPase subunit a
MEKYTLINSPLDQFEVLSLIGLKLELLGLENFTLTNHSLYMIFVLTTIIAIHFYGDNQTKIVPNK